MKKLICRVFGHRMDVMGVTGNFKWCSRCAYRSPFRAHDPLVQADMNGLCEDYFSGK